MDMNAEVCAPLAYARIRGSVRADSKPMPHWDDLQETEQRLLCMMWYLGAEDAAAAFKETLEKK